METVSVDGGHLVHYCGGCQWRRQRGVKGGSFPLWVDVQKLCNMCVMNVRKDRQAANLLKSYRTKPYKFPMHWSKCVSFWGTSYSRPPIDPYLLVGGVA